MNNSYKYETFEILPDHFYDGRDGAPVFKPTMEQFKNFGAFVASVKKYGSEYGIIKVIPPDLSNKLENINIKNPIEQLFMRQKSGTYVLKNVERKRNYTVEQWAQFCREKHMPPEPRYWNPRIPPKLSKNESETTTTIATSSDDENSVNQQTVELLSLTVVPNAKFDYRKINSSLPYNEEEYIKELERTYWRNLPYDSPFYGADLSGSLFSDCTKYWNLNNLDNLLNELKSIPGVNKTYLYFGMWKASFAWHIEDKDLYSINYIHFGAPKQWYSISPLRASNFELHMKGWFPHAQKECSQFLRHKEYIASPINLSEAPIIYHRLVQREGEFVITFPRGYHSGFNLGFNCAESVNFAFEDWIEHGIKAKSCTCRSDSVQIDVKSLFGHFLQNKDENNYHYNETPDSNFGPPIFPNSHRIKPSTSNKKHKTDRKVKYLSYNSDNMLNVSSSSSSQSIQSIYKNSTETIERSASKIKKSNKYEPYPTDKNSIIAKNDVMCYLCPVRGKEVLHTMDGRYAHYLCATFIPETFVANRQEFGEETVVIQITDIPNSRKKMMCEICKTSEGVCIQCCKCTTAFHVFCAHDAGILLVERLVGKSQIFHECYCKLHQPNNLDKERKLPKSEQKAQNGNNNNKLQQPQNVISTITTTVKKKKEKEEVVFTLDDELLLQRNDFPILDDF
nr:2903_t:CDS:10 [Entrophospora candida]